MSEILAKGIYWKKEIPKKQLTKQQNVNGLNSLIKRHRVCE